MPRGTDLPNWRNSKARVLLLKKLESGEIPATMAPLAVWESEEEFMKHRYTRQFRPNLNALRKQVQERQQYVDFDANAYNHDRALHPISDVECRGYPRWHGDAAEMFLINDIDEKRHEWMTPNVLWCSRPEYKRFPLEVFRNHVYQECRSRLGKPYWIKKKEDKIKKKRGEAIDVGNGPANGVIHI
jgi:hypothetical protein